ncbi:MAG: NACHT domain-containing protein [Pseudoxanthomonas sp.]|nr:NACHT domain-containing protein [Pseudoxanthomonas sp.]
MIDNFSAESLAKPVAEVAKGATVTLVREFVDRVVTPYFLKKKSRRKIVHGVLRYSRNIELRTRNIPTIAIQGGSFLLDEVYEPLFLVRSNPPERHLVDSYPIQLFAQHRCLAIVDGAGMGKSTLTKFVVRQSIKRLGKIPLLVELRRLRRGQGIMDFIGAEVLGRNGTSSAHDDFIESISEGNYIFMLDGYDEVDPELRAQVSQEVSDLSVRYHFCNFWLTSRPDPVISSLSSFAVFEIDDLTKEQAVSLLRRYDCGKGVANQLIEKIRGLPEVEEFLGNPLLVTLLYKAFDYKAIIPIKRNIFFRQVFDALYQDHDLSKGGGFERRKASNIDIEDLHRVLRWLGMKTFAHGRVQFSQAEFTEAINDSINSSGIQVDGAKLRSDLLSAVPIFVKDGDEVRWSHKAFQDYFASQFLYLDSQAKKRDLIGQLFCSKFASRSENLLRMLAEVDMALVRGECVVPFLEECEVYSEEYSDAEIAVRVLKHAIKVFLVRISGAPVEDPQEWVEQVIQSVRRLGVDHHASHLDMMLLQREKLVIAIAASENVARLRALRRIDPATFVGVKSKVKGGYRFRDLLNGSECEISLVDLDMEAPLTRELLAIVCSLARVQVPSRESIRDIKAAMLRAEDSRGLEGIFRALA